MTHSEGLRPLVRSGPIIPAGIRVRVKSQVPPVFKRGNRFARPALFAGVTVLLLAVSLGYFELSEARAVSAESVAPVSLGLRVSHTGSGLKLSWDPSAKAFRDANAAELLITDGEQSRLLLSASQILRGRLWYTPITNDVRFNLRVESANRLVSETAFALDAPLANYVSMLQAPKRFRREPAPAASPMPQGAVTFPSVKDPLP